MFYYFVWTFFPIYTYCHLRPPGIKGHQMIKYKLNMSRWLWTYVLSPSCSMVECRGCLFLRRWVLGCWVLWKVVLQGRWDFYGIFQGTLTLSILTDVTNLVNLWIMVNFAKRPFNYSNYSLSTGDTLYICNNKLKIWIFFKKKCFQSTFWACLILSKITSFNVSYYERIK